MRVANTIRIDAPIDVVWQVTQDVEAWPEWTPTVTSVRLVGAGPLQLGSVALIRQPLQPESSWTVTEFSAGRRFAWETRRPGLRMKATHELASAPGGTINTLTLHASGILSVLLWPLLRPAVAKALSEENRGLKARCERVPAG